MDNSIEKPSVLIATLPKSGTWYNHCFFWCYEQLLKNADAYLKGNYAPNLEEALYGEEKIHHSSLESREAMGLHQLFIFHASCPGFENLNDERMAQWEAIQFRGPGYILGDPCLKQHNLWGKFGNGDNKNYKIVYFYRNPLDQFVSHFHHAQNHIDKSLQSHLLPNGSRIPINNLHDHILYNKCLTSFIKHYYTFKKMHERYPEKVLLMPYEHLSMNPHEAFLQSLTFIGIPPKDDIQQQLFNKALELSSKDSITTIESKKSYSFVRDQEGQGKHLRNGEIGQWQSQSTYTQDKLEAIELTLNLFGISLEEFTVHPHKTALELFPWLAETKQQQYRLHFFKQLLVKDNTSQTLELLDNANHKIDTLISEIRALKSSRSWRLTKPLRQLVTLIRKIKTFPIFSKNAVEPSA